jgi:glycosyltransferase involved in cell wall biosynthesis
VRPNGAPGDGLHLLEVGMRWPPETFVQRKLQGLARRGYRVTVVSPVNRVEGRARVPGVELLRVPHWAEPRRAKLVGGVLGAARLAIRDPRRLRALMRSIRASLPAGRRGWRDQLAALRRFAPLADLRPDIVHFEWESAAVDHLALFDIWNAPIMVSCHGAGVNRQPHAARWRERSLSGFPLVFRRAALVHCVADAVAANARHYGLDPEKARIIRPGIDPTEFCPSPHRDESDELRLITVARLIWGKGFEYGLVAIAQLVEQGVPVRYEILGTDPHPDIGEVSDRPRIEHTIDDLGLRERVTLSGHLAPHEVRAALCRSHVYVHPSLSEGLATVIAEGMSCALPVAVTDVGGARELVRDGIDGFLVSPRDPAALAAAVKRLWEDPELRRRMGDAARERICTEFTLDRHVERYVELYAEVARASGAAG